MQKRVTFSVSILCIQLLLLDITKVLVHEVFVVWYVVDSGDIFDRVCHTLIFECVTFVNVFIVGLIVISVILLFDLIYGITVNVNIILIRHLCVFKKVIFKNLVKL